MRINQYLSDSGLCSRRQADQWIEEGRVQINGKTALLGQQVGEDDIVKADGKSVHPKRQHVYLALNKPKGVICTTDRSVEGNIIDYMEFKERIYPIGRLDKDSEGLLLLTSDGSIVNQILRKENGHAKEYQVRVNKPLTEEMIQALRTGVRIFNPVSSTYTLTLPCKVRKIDQTSFRIELHQGLNRQIRRMCESQGYYVRALTRLRISDIALGNLPKGSWRYLTAKEVKSLRESRALPAAVAAFKKKTALDQ